VLLALSLTLKWATCSIDFTNAFVQAELKDPVWIHVPRGFRSTLQTKTCLKLNKSLYGLSVAPRLWFHHLLDVFLKLGFTQCRLDKCLLHNANIIVVIYVDDVGIAYRHQKHLDQLLENLAKHNLMFTKEGTFTDFLGIKFVQDTNTSTITLNQRGLISKIIAATKMQDCNGNWTPAPIKAIGSDPEGEPMHESWSYRSIIGMLLYLSTNTRPDITYAVSQAARFSKDPKKSHATAIKTIVRYLHKTSQEGMKIKLTGSLDLACYVDADFAGLHGREVQNDATSAKSRTGYIITFGGFPIIWKSQLQTAVALCTMEAEYSALSSAIRVLLPIQSLLNEILPGVNQQHSKSAPMVRCRVFEDNNGALQLATQHQLTSRTKYFHVKWHHFWDHVTRGEIVIRKINTEEQRADYLTKALDRTSFERIRFLVQGW